MTTRKKNLQTKLDRTAAQIFAANERMNQMIIEQLDPAAWRAKPPGKSRPIVAIFTHVHNVRCKWIRLTAPHLKVSQQLQRAHCTPQQARAGLAESAARCAEMLAEALGDGQRPCQEVSPRWLGATVASRRGNVVLHVGARSAPSRPSVHAGASTGIPAAEQSGLRNLELGKIVEGLWFPFAASSLNSGIVSG